MSFWLITEKKNYEIFPLAYAQTKEMNLKHTVTQSSSLALCPTSISHHSLSAPNLSLVHGSVDNAKRVQNKTVFMMPATWVPSAAKRWSTRTCKEKKRAWKHKDTVSKPRLSKVQYHLSRGKSKKTPTGRNMTENVYISICDIHLQHLTFLR